jgi:hypothetical protein
MDAVPVLSGIIVLLGVVGGILLIAAIIAMAKSSYK